MVSVVLDAINVECKRQGIHLKFETVLVCELDRKKRFGGIQLESSWACILFSQSGACGGLTENKSEHVARRICVSLLRDSDRGFGKHTIARRWILLWHLGHSRKPDETLRFYFLVLARSTIITVSPAKALEREIGVNGYRDS
jgi:hypothetical protein